MSRRDLVDGYLAGNVGRREFIRGLVALGMSASAATAYAVALSSEAAAAKRRAASFDFYDFYNMCLGRGWKALGFKDQARCFRAVVRNDLRDFLRALLRGGR
jgi:hypothetical protein